MEIKRHLGCLGPHGTFTEQAALLYSMKYNNMLEHEAFEIKRYPTIEDVIFAVEREEIYACIVPYENTIEGIVNVTMDSLIFETKLFIQAQLILPISQNLLVPTDYEGELDFILSHPQGLAQSRKFIRENYNGAKQIPVSSTAEAAEIVSAGMERAAAIGNMLSAEIYGLKALHRDVQENKHNATTFAVLSKKNTSMPKKGWKTSLAFSTKNKPGELYKLLDIFALWDLNMTKIQSRPMKNKPGEYVFLIDIEDYTNIDDINDALKMVFRKTNFYKNLGSYPVFDNSKNVL